MGRDTTEGDKHGAGSWGVGHHGLTSAVIPGVRGVVFLGFAWMFLGVVQG